MAVFLLFLRIVRGIKLGVRYLHKAGEFYDFLQQNSIRMKRYNGVYHKIMCTQDGDANQINSSCWQVWHDLGKKCTFFPPWNLSLSTVL